MYRERDIHVYICIYIYIYIYRERERDVCLHFISRLAALATTSRHGHSPASLAERTEL